MDRETANRSTDSNVTKTASATTLSITSSAFADGQPIPRRYSCQGDGLSPDLRWSGVPRGARSLALIVEDPDAPSGMVVHWVMFNIPPTVTMLDSNQPMNEQLSNMAHQGMNGANKLGWVPPCPPNGTHRYYFRLYALDTVLSIAEKPDRQALLDAMKGHVLAEGVLMGTYKKS